MMVFEIVEAYIYDANFAYISILIIFYKLHLTLTRRKPHSQAPGGHSASVCQCLIKYCAKYKIYLQNTCVLGTIPTRKMPEEWRKSIQYQKNKGDIQSCINHTGTKLMSHNMKLWERVVEHRLRVMTTVSENQFGFIPNR